MEERQKREPRALRTDRSNVLRVDQKNAIVIEEEVLRGVMELDAICDLEQEIAKSEAEMERARAELQRARSREAQTQSAAFALPSRTSTRPNEEAMRAAALFAQQQAMRPVFAPGFMLAGPLRTQWSTAGHQLGLVHGIAHQANGLMSMMPGYPLSMVQQCAVRLFPGA